MITNIQINIYIAVIHVSYKSEHWLSLTMFYLILILSCRRVNNNSLSGPVPDSLATARMMITLYFLWPIILLSSLHCYFNMFSCHVSFTHSTFLRQEVPILQGYFLQQPEWFPANFSSMECLVSDLKFIFLVNGCIIIKLTQRHAWIVLMVIHC